MAVIFLTVFSAALLQRHWMVGEAIERSLCGTWKILIEESFKMGKGGRWQDAEKTKSER